MPLLVTGSAMLSCTFGAAPSTLQVLPVNKVLVNMPAANIMDQVPMLNIPPFGVCSSIANPMVASATAAALGVLTPMPCIPMTVAPWAAGKPTVLIGNMPALSSDSKLMCCWGGCISISFPGQTIVSL
ncbi:MAG: hypothetical protein CTY34_06565 [Methylobacter sp.]|nr:MAG: hypothetical protein CTY34_06565 [Methylobacter sp.]PPD04261.1 MAG: hypothetical protein CTY29_06250 [Methylobacter sp.]PPD19701.1 MAG: hypothetical protein CTY24_10385 [Methylobacter sp.]PPD28452.1 MAG: hypothetical protein CTY21_13135 [Methylomonas sp.]PPD36710.1 MAG: hypothetical protein CTY18_02705 [Methylomonas sp.]